VRTSHSMPERLGEWWFCHQKWESVRREIGTSKQAFS
jgi:hypothetical protein